MFSREFALTHPGQAVLDLLQAHATEAKIVGFSERESVMGLIVSANQDAAGRTNFFDGWRRKRDYVLKALTDTVVKDNNRADHPGAPGTSGPWQI